MSNQAIRNQRAMAKGQEEYDNRQPPGYWEEDAEVIDIDIDDGYDGILGEG